jgi:hypothetical protein
MASMGLKLSHDMPHVGRTVDEQSPQKFGASHSTKQRLSLIPQFYFGFIANLRLSISTIADCFRTGNARLSRRATRTPPRMPRKIFISYRRQDSAANALGIGQYLEHEFGRKNVFIDVDMHAGANFPTVLEQRLAECKVMIVLIGPDWLDARDEQGHRRLEHPDDWVRFEIARALKRNITVIPVRVGGGGLPSKAALPEDIRGLLDRQATSITTTGFRNDMAGLVRDIRSIPSPLPLATFWNDSSGSIIVVSCVSAHSGFRRP